MLLHDLELPFGSVFCPGVHGNAVDVQAHRGRLDGADPAECCPLCPLSIPPIGTSNGDVRQRVARIGLFPDSIG